MNTSDGWFRLKIVWAIICVVVAVAFLGILSQGNLAQEVFFRFIIGVAVAAGSLAFLPFEKIALHSKLALGFIGLCGGLAYAEGPGKWPEGLVISVVLAALFWCSWVGLVWVYKGFFGSRK